MKDLILKNNLLTVHVNAYGAELKSIEKDGLEYLWQGDPAYYDRTSPTIFPIMGRFLSETYYVGDQAYHMGINGFALSRNFTIEHQAPDAVTFRLDADERTLTQYPFRFTLRVSYALDGAQVKVKFSVENHDEKPLPFCVGLHTAYRWPLEGENAEDCYIRFEENENIASFNPFNWKDADFIRNGYLEPKHAYWANFTRSMTGFHSRWLEFGMKGSGHGIRLHREELPFLAMWTLPDERAKYLCLEPSTSVHAGAASTIEERNGTIVLPSGENCTRGFEIEVF